MSTVNQAYGSYSALTVTNLQTLSSSATAIWQSDLIDIQTSTKALDYEVMVTLPVNNTAPGSDKAMYVFVVPFVTSDAGITWLPGDIGTTTLPTGTQGTATINSSSALKLLGILNYVTANQTCRSQFNLSNAFGQSMPDGFSLLIENFSGATLASACVVAIRAITQTIT